MSPSAHSVQRNGATAMPDRRLVRLVWLIAAVGLLPIVGLLAATAIAGGIAGSSFDLLAELTLALGLAVFVVSGAIIVARQPRNLVGWLLMLPGMVLPANEIANVWLRSLDPIPSEVTPALWLLMVFTSAAWVLLIFPILHLLLIFPSGQLPSRRWRPIVWLEAGMLGTLVIVASFGAFVVVLDDEGQGVWSLPNPIGFLPADFFTGGVAAIWGLLLLSLTVASVAAFVLRFRRGTRDERRQLKWPLLAVALFGLVYGSASVWQSLASGPLFTIAIAFIPISVAIAVTRYRLYDIDRIVSRTVSWLLVTALIGGVFAVGIVLFSTLLRPLTGGETLAVAGSTLAAAALFQPIRGRIQRAVDRRFNRVRYDQQRIAEAFAADVRGLGDVDRLAARLRDTIDAAVEPATVGIWVGVERSARDVSDGSAERAAERPGRGGR
ncbi:MAG TPA: hypothetical protein VFS32_00450 [Candidatus Limnocylindrales bacterium]|nr:hypothetical protein [Candidatus Limnocylindrales bacterium]